MSSDHSRRRVSRHTYHLSFFLLRVPISIRGQPAQITTDDGHLTIGCPPVSITFDSLITEVDNIVKKYGLEGVSNYWCDDVPLFEVKLFSPDDLRRLLRSEEIVRNELASRIAAALAKKSSDIGEVYAHTELYMLTPHPESKDARIIRVSSEKDLDTCTTMWESEVFNFEALFHAFRTASEDISNEDVPPRITIHPQELIDVAQGKSVVFTIQAIGTEPMNYDWQWKPTEERGVSKQWQQCSAKWSDGATLTIPKVKKSHEGSYRCVVSNLAGSQTSTPSKLSVGGKPTGGKLPGGTPTLPSLPSLPSLPTGETPMPPLPVVLPSAESPQRSRRRSSSSSDSEPPRVTIHPQDLRNVAQGKSVKFSIQSTGTGLLNYKWEWMPSGEEGGAKQWQPCHAKWCKGPTLTISKMDELNEGSYRCVVTNDAGSDVSNPATLTTSKPPRITTHPQKLKDVIPGKSAKFTVQATGTEPLNYNWQWKRDEKGSGSKQWQPCEEGWSDGATLTIPSVQKPNEGSYRCVVSNRDGNQISKAAQLSVANCPRMTTHPQELKDVVQGKPAKFSIEASGTEPLNYRWQWKPAEEGDENEEWQECDTKWCKGPTLSISKVEKSHEGSYRCIVSNLAGDQTSISAKLTVVEPPKIITHPQELKEVVQGESAKFTIQASGTEPLNYHWQWKPAEKGSGSDKWQRCPANWSDGATLTVPNVDKSNEGSYRCVVSNNVGEQTSNPAKLGVVQPPRIVTHPQELREVVEGKSARFSIKATGTEPFNYKWQWQPTVEGCASEEWEPCRAKWSSGATLTIPKVEKSNEGNYHCVVSNFAGDQTSNPAELTVAEPPRITNHPQKLKDAIPGKSAKFTVQATGTEPLNYNWQWKRDEKGSGSKEWQPCEEEWSDGATLTIPSVQKPNEGSYRCVVSNHAGTQISKAAQLSVADTPRITTHPQELKDIAQGKPAKFSIEASGTEPLNYRWQWKPVEEGDENEEWQECDSKWCKGPTLSISKVEKSNEGSYRCIVSNFAGNQTSIPAKLTVVEPPQITTHPEDLKDSIALKPAKFAIQAIGTEPLNYDWQWKPSEKGSGSKEWQPCDVAWSDGATLIIPSVQKFYEGKYRCVVSNSAGSQISKAAQLSVVEPPRITTHPQDIKDAVRRKSAKFTVQATGTEPLKYNWQWKPNEKESEEWQPCSAEWCNGTILTVPSVQKLNKESYRCVISNLADTQLSEAAQLNVELKVDVQGESAKFTIEASGTEPLNYYWQWKQTEGVRSEKWQPCPSKWSDGATLTVPKVEESKEGSYRCVVSNNAGEQTSIPAKLTIAEPPRITTNPQNLKADKGKNAKFTTHAIGTEPLNYKWEWKPAVDDSGSKNWQLCDAKWSNDATLTIPEVDICNEGSYRCVVSNFVGSQTSKPAKLELVFNGK